LPTRRHDETKGTKKYLVSCAVPEFLARCCRRLVLLTACGSVTACSGTQLRLNDEKTQQIVKEIRSAEDAFRQRRARFGGLKELIDAGLLPGSLADGMEAGHRFELRANENTYQAVAVPAEKDDRYAYVGWAFYVDESGVVRGMSYGKDNGYVIAGKDAPPVRSQ
jgi:hypothetical protein